MQTILIIAAQSGVSGQQPFLASGAGQHPLGAEGDGDGFSEILADDADRVRSGPIGAEAVPSSAAVFPVGFPWPFPTTDARKAPLSGSPEPDPNVTGQGIVSNSGVSLPVPAPLAMSVSVLPTPVAAGPETAHPAMNTPEVAATQGVGDAALAQGPDTLRDMTAGGQSQIRQGLAGLGELAWRQAGLPARQDKSTGAILADPEASGSDALAKGAGRVTSNRQQALTVDLPPVALPAVANADAAVGTSAALGSFGTVSPGMGQHAALAPDGALPDMAPLAGDGRKPDPLTTGAETPDRQERGHQRVEGQGDARTEPDLPDLTGPARDAEPMRLAPPTSAAESLWRGTALARFAERGAAADALAAMTLTTGQMPGFSTSSDPGHDAVAFGPGHPPVPAGGPTAALARLTPQPVAGDLSAVPALPVDGAAATDEDLAFAAGLISSSAAPVMMSVAAPQAGNQVPAALAHLSGQIATALAQRPNGVTDIALSPDELGRVHMTLQADAQNPDRMVVYLTFDRPETLDLFRRHADQLAEAIRTAGYAGADINFGQSGTGAGGSFSPGTNDAGVRSASGPERAATQPGNPLQDTSHGAGDRRPLRPGSALALNLRL
jgi:hypothetical protein